MTNLETCKLLVLDFLKTQVSTKFSDKCRSKLDLDDDAKLPGDHPTLLEIFADYMGSKKTQKSAKKAGKKRKVDPDGIIPDDEEESPRPKKSKANGSVASKDSSYESETESSNGNNQSSACFNCQKKGHFSRECPEKPALKCYNCQETGHLSRQCPEKPSPKCFNCNSIGHMSRDCPARQNRNSGGGGRPRTSFGYGYSGSGSNSVPLGPRKSTGGSEK